MPLACTVHCMTTITVNVFDDNGDEHTLALPAKFEVCYVCDGEGSLPDRAMSPTGDGSWTGSEMADFYDADPDFAEDYFAGRYQQACPECKGLRVLPEPDTERADPADVALYEAHLAAEADYAAERAAELRMGC